jgi:hypothetical protein
VSPRRAKPRKIKAPPPTASNSNPRPGPVKAREPELADVTPDDGRDAPPDPAAVATRALVVVGSTVVFGPVVCGGLVVGTTVVRGTDASVVGDGAVVIGALVGGAAVAAAVVGGTGVGGAVVGGPGGVVLGGTDDADVAIVGDSGDPDGAFATIPVAALLLGYAMHVSDRELPDTSSVSLALLSWLIVMGPPDAVKGPMVAAVGGITRRTPVDGIGLGSAMLKLIDPVAIDDGVAPVASTTAVAVPAIELLPRAAAADAIEDGSVTWVW